MFASLVVVLPTVHEGGSLIIRHNGKEWTFDSSKVVKTGPSPDAAFVAFFSDVEHEVTPVTSGYRVTLTYNLYLKKKDTGDRAVDAAAFGQNDSELKKSLAALLKNPAFLPEGGILGFGFAHKYPFSQASTSLFELKGNLKGVDAALRRACDSLSLSCTVKAVYREDSAAILVNHFVDFGHGEIEDDIVEFIKEYDNGEIVYNFGDKPPRSDYRDEDMEATPIMWVKPLAKTNTFSSSYLHYGNEASLEYVYGEICLVATVLPAKERAT